MAYNPLQMQPSQHQLTISLTAKVQAVHRAEARHLRCGGTGLEKWTKPV